MEFIETNIPGVIIIQATVQRDSRGSFVKVFHSDLFKVHGMQPFWNESYLSHSEAGVVRGLHFQLPPSDHSKLVTCVRGRVFDVAVDMRKESSTYGQYVDFTLDSEVGNALFMPSGIAHGFCTTEGPATLSYLTTSVYSPELDSGVSWDSVGITWPIADPIISERDSQLVKLTDFQSPF